MHRQNILDMYSAVETGRGFDVVIIVSSDSAQADFWQQRLSSSRGAVIGKNTQVISVEEDWPGGAGQLLGTLYAWEKARTHHDLQATLEQNGTIAMYHTAGKGTRMAPLPASEANNKSAIKLPRIIENDDGKRILTVLEAVIFQTGIFATSRQGRLCVFWGDQVFIPSKAVDYEGRCHAEILDIRDRIPSDPQTWEREWQSYGLIIPTPEGGALQREKQTWDELQNLISSGTVQADPSGGAVLGKSLGCFSLSNKLLRALLDESEEELNQKQLKLDTDPHLWMPLTSSREEFVAGGGDVANWKRVARFSEQFQSEDENRLLMFGDMDLGAQTLWWDYGQVQLYHRNFLKALEDSFEGECMRLFFDLEKYRTENTFLIESQVRGPVKNSILISSDIGKADISDSVVINSSVGELKGENLLVYNCNEPSTLGPESGAVIADIRVPNLNPIRMKTNLSRDGKEDWEETLSGNPYSYAKLAEVVADSLT
ncbi:MAG: hypothetical protein R6U37_00825 [Dehalococcoidia bacterium]